MTTYIISEGTQRHSALTVEIENPNALNEILAQTLRGYAGKAGYALADAEFLIKWLYDGVLPFNTSRLMDALRDLNAHTRAVFEKGVSTGYADAFAEKGE
jgi:hypothetical protein